MKMLPTNADKVFKRLSARDLWKNRVENPLRRETSDAIALVVFVIFMKYVYIIIYVYY